MGRKEHAPETPATVFLRNNHVNFLERPYGNVEHGSTAE
jgi:hypothetical protein